MNKLKEHEEKALELRKMLFLVEEEITNIKKNEQLPLIKEKYEGKWFKYDNGYSKEDKFTTYCYCLKIVDINIAIYDQFDNYDGDFRFSLNKEGYLHLFQTEISEEEYKEALEKYKNEFEKLWKL